MKPIHRSAATVLLVGLSAGALTAGGLASTASTPLAEADRLFEAESYEEARAAYAAILENPPPDTSLESLGAVHLSLGRTLQRLGRCEEAISWFRSAIGLEGRDGRPRELSYGNWAQWEIGNCFFQRGDYGAAIEAFQSAERDHPYQTFCGTDLESHRHLFHLNVAVLHEYLHEYDAAVGDYLAITYERETRVHLHLLNLYEAAGQMGDLLSLLDQEDLRRAAAIEKVAAQYPGSKRSTIAERSAASATIHRILEVRQLEKARDWKGLLEIISPTVGGGGANAAEEFDKEESAGILARHPESTLPLLLKQLDNEPVRGNFPRSVCYALGLTRSPQGVAALKARVVVKPQNWYFQAALLYDLERAGPLGRNALEELRAEGLERPSKSVERILHDEPAIPPGSGYALLPFPPIPVSLELPSVCEVREARRDEYVCTRGPVAGTNATKRMPARPDF